MLNVLNEQAFTNPREEAFIVHEIQELNAIMQSKRERYNIKKTLSITAATKVAGWRNDYENMDSIPRRCKSDCEVVWALKKPVTKA